MAKKKQKELKDLSVVELQEKAQSLGREVFDLRNLLVMQRKLEQPHLIKAKRHERARVLTLLTQKQGVTV